MALRILPRLLKWVLDSTSIFIRKLLTARYPFQDLLSYRYFNWQESFHLIPAGWPAKFLILR